MLIMMLLIEVMRANSMNLPYMLYFILAKPAAFIVMIPLKQLNFHGLV